MSRFRNMGGEWSFNRCSHPIGFWVYVSLVTAFLGLLWMGLGRPLTSDEPLLRFMAVGALLILAGVLYGPSTLDMTGWTLLVCAMPTFGLILLLGSPLAYALWVAFVGDHIQVTIQ